MKKTILLLVAIVAVKATAMVREAVEATLRGSSRLRRGFKALGSKTTPSSTVMLSRQMIFAR